MEIDSDFLEVRVTENEFDESATLAASEEVQEMDTSLAEETSSKLEIASKGNQEDLRLKIKRNKEKDSDMANDDRVSVNKERHEARRNRGSDVRRKRGDERNQRNQSNGRLYKALDASSDLDPKILGRELAYRLGEAKVGLIANVVRVLGFKCAMEILEDTREIERNGGMLTADGTRRRTPGGVYICCLKERGYATKKEIERIFKDEKERAKDKLKRKRQEQAARRRKEEENLSKLRKRVIDYVNKKLEVEAGKEDGELSEEKKEMVPDGQEEKLANEISENPFVKTVT